MNKIEYSNWTFTDADIVSGSVAMENAMMFDSLNPDELTVEVISHATGTGKVLVQPPSGTTLEWYTTVDGRGYVVNDGDIRDFTYGDPVWYYYDGVLQGKYYIKSVERLSIDHFRINAFSMVGLWANIQDLGGVYTGQSAGTIIKQMINGGENLIGSAGSTTTSNGVTFTKEDDGLWILNGTAVATAECYIEQTHLELPDYLTDGESYYLSINSDGIDVSLYFEMTTTYGKIYLKKASPNKQTIFRVLPNVLDLWIYLSVSRDTVLVNQRVIVSLSKSPRRLFDYTVDPDVAAIPVYGWLPVASVRDNLQQVLFSVGASLVKDSVGNPHIKFLQNLSPIPVDDSRIFIGGKLNYKTPATEVIVTEHSFYKSNLDVRESLFDNTGGQSGTDEQLVTFDSPHYDLEWNGSSVDGGDNYYYASGSGVLTGKPYTHTTRMISVPTGRNGWQKESKVEKATLVSLVNSANVAQRVADYQATAEEVSCGVVMNDDNIKCGSLISFNDPYGEATQGLISKMNVTMSGKSKADCTIVKGYTPSHFGNNFTSYQLLTLSGTYTASKTGTIRVVLGQGGQGGSGGSMGTVGDTNTAGVGGAFGQGGSAGKVYIIDLSVTAGQTYSYTIGTKGSSGNGQTTSDTPATTGSNGGHSTFGGYTSNSGSIPTNGYVNILSGEIYSLNGAAGINGGNGGDWGEDGEYVEIWGGGFGAPNYGSVRSGIGGGGAAFGNDGGDAIPHTQGGSGTSGLGYAGNGANAYTRSLAISFGSGGTGGNGGGGSGRAPLVGNIDWGHYGTAGTGSNGTAGGQGYIIVYE